MELVARMSRAFSGWPGVAIEVDQEGLHGVDRSVDLNRLFQFLDRQPGRTLVRCEVGTVEWPGLLLGEHFGQGVLNLLDLVVEPVELLGELTLELRPSNSACPSAAWSRSPGQIQVVHGHVKFKELEVEPEQGHAILAAWEGESTGWRNSRR